MTIFIIDSITGQKLVNPYVCIGIFGKPGSGKSTLSTKMQYKFVKKGWMVYTDVPNNVDGAIQFDSLAFKRGDFLPDGRKGYVNENGVINDCDRDIVMFFDEMGVLYNNREFKSNLNPETLMFWKTHRHRRVRIVYLSQSYKDMDLKIRALTQKMYLVKRGILKNFSVAKAIMVKLDIENQTDASGNGGGGGTIVEKYQYDLPIFWKFTLLPRWIKKFDSYR